MPVIHPKYSNDSFVKRILDNNEPINDSKFLFENFLINIIYDTEKQRLFGNQLQ